MEYKKDLQVKVNKGDLGLHNAGMKGIGMFN